MKGTHYDQNIDAGESVVNVTINGDNNKVITPSVADAARQGLEEEFSKNNYSIFLSGASHPEGGKGEGLLDKLRKDLEENDFDVVVGGDQLNLEELDEESEHPNIAEAESVKRERFNSVVILADDYVTFSQASLMFYVRVSERLDNVDLVLVSLNKVSEDSEFFKNGLFAMTDDFGGKLIQLDEWDDFDVKIVTERMRRRRTVLYQQRRGRR